MLDEQDTLTKQKRAVPPTFGTDFKPNTDAQGDLRFIMTPALIQSIFAQNPQVRKAYQENVPDKATEKDFWTQYFKSRFFKDDLSSTGIGGKADGKAENILDRYYTPLEAKSDAQQQPEAISRLVDISADDRFEYGVLGTPRVRSAKEEETLALMRRFNERSGQLVKNFDGAKESVEEHGEIGDLYQLGTPKALPLAIAPRDSVVQRVLPETSKAASRPATLQVLREWKPSLDRIQHLHISFGQYSAFMPAVHYAADNSPAFDPENLTVVKHAELLTFHSNVCEILRLFWANFPHDTQEKQAKVIRMVGLIGKLKAKLLEWMQQAARDESVYIETTLRTLRDAMENAEALYASAASKDSNKRPRLL